LNINSYLTQRIKGGEKVPRCSCGGILKPGTILFGEPLQPEVLETAQKMLQECDLLIVMGTSLKVMPANTLPTICLNRNIPLVICNLDPTQYDDFAAVLIQKEVGATMKEVLQVLTES